METEINPPHPKTYIVQPTDVSIDAIPLNPPLLAI